MRIAGYVISQICEVLGIGNKSVIKYTNINDCDKEEYDKKPVAEMVQENNRRRKEELIKNIKQLKCNGYLLRAIARKSGLDHKTIAKYINSDGTFIHSSLGRNFKSKLDDYKTGIFNLMDKGFKSCNCYILFS
jgi:hypothetical protein